MRAAGSAWPSYAPVRSPYVVVRRDADLPVPWKAGIRVFIADRTEDLLGFSDVPFAHVATIGQEDRLRVAPATLRHEAPQIWSSERLRLPFEGMLLVGY